MNGAGGDIRHNLVSVGHQLGDFSNVFVEVTDDKCKRFESGTRSIGSSKQHNWERFMTRGNHDKDVEPVVLIHHYTGRYRVVSSLERVVQYFCSVELTTQRLPRDVGVKPVNLTLQKHK